MLLVQGLGLQVHRPGEGRPFHGQRARRERGHRVRPPVPAESGDPRAPGLEAGDQGVREVVGADSGRPAQRPVREGGEGQGDEREEAAGRGGGAVQRGVPGQEVGQCGVEGVPVLRGQGAQRVQRRTARPGGQRLAGLLGAGADPVQGGVHGGELGRGARRVVLLVARVVQDDGHQPGGEFADGGAPGLFDELVPGEAERLPVPGGPVPEHREAERVGPLPGRDALLGGVLAPVVAHAEVHVVQEDLEAAVGVVGRVGDGAGRRLGGVLEDGPGLRRVQVGRLDGQGAQIVQELVGDRLPRVGAHAPALGHGPHLTADAVGEVLPGRRHGGPGHLMTFYAHDDCPAP